MPSDIERIQKGDATKYNTTLDILYRMNRLLEMAAVESLNSTPGGHRRRLSFLDTLRREILPYLNEKERDEVTSAKVGSIPIMAGRGDWFKSGVEAYSRDRLDRYEELIRYMMVKKGMQIRAEESQYTSFDGDMA